MGDAISTCFKKYGTFSGRASRSEYWYFILFGWIYVIFERVVISATNSVSLALLFTLGYYGIFLVPTLAAAVRRVHDVGKPWGYAFIPIYNIVLFCTPGTGDNEYGEQIT